MRIKADSQTQNQLTTILWNLLLIAAGTEICVIALNGILVPHGFLSAGFAGLALILHYLLPGLSLGLLYFLLNIPVFALGWQRVGRRFFLYSLAGMLSFSLAAHFTSLSIPIKDDMLAAILAGIIGGVGSGLVLRSLGSGGGTDILGVILLRKYSIRLGTTVLIFNAGVLMVTAALFSLDAALYTLIYIYVSSKVLDLVVTGLSKRKAILIISKEWRAISAEILKQDRRGLTVIEGRGAYEGKERHLLYAVITHQDLPELKRLITAIDPQAFVVVSNTLEVIGQRMGNQPHW